MLSDSIVYNTLIRNRKKDVLRFFMIALALTACQAPMPYLSGYLIDEVLLAGDMQMLLWLTLLLATLGIVDVGLSYLDDRLRLRLQREMMVELLGRGIRGILGLSRNRRLQLRNGDLMSRLTRDADQLSVVMPDGLADLAHQALLALSLLVVVFIIDWQLSAILVLLLPVAVLVYMRFDSALWSSSEAETKASARKMAVIQEVIEADAEIKSYQAETFFLRHTGKGIEDFEDKSYIREMYDLKVSTLIAAIPMLAGVLIWYLGGSRVISGEFSVGLIVTYSATLAMIVPSLVSIVGFFSSLPNEVTALKRMVDLFPKEDIPRAAAPHAADNTLAPGVDALVLRDIGFSYTPEAPLFEQLDLRFERGKSYLINGGNGSGKSTLLTILAGALQPQCGEVLLGEQPLQGLPQRSAWLTYLPQKVHLVSDSVFHNVTFGANYSEGEVEAVLRRVGLGEWVDQIGDGVHHYIQDPGSELSGGQIQKIGLARALLRDTPILLLDEPTNNLDSLAVKQLVDTLREHRSERIVVIVSHDERVTDAVDMLIQLENSSVAEPTRFTLHANAGALSPSAPITPE